MITTAAITAPRWISSSLNAISMRGHGRGAASVDGDVGARGAVDGVGMGRIHRDARGHIGADALDPRRARTRQRWNRFGGQALSSLQSGIAMLEAVGLVALRGTERSRRHPVVATLYGAGSALIVDELALLLDLEDVYWAREGRTSVDAAVIVIGVGDVVTAGFEFWPRAQRHCWAVDTECRQSARSNSCASSSREAAAPPRWALNVAVEDGHLDKTPELHFFGPSE